MNDQEQKEFIMRAVDTLKIVDPLIAASIIMAIKSEYTQHLDNLMGVLKKAADTLLIK